MALSKAMTSQLSSQVSMDTDPITPQIGGSRYRPNFSLSSENMSADALAGPEDASRRSTQELKEEARLADARQAAASTQRRPENLYIEKMAPKMGGGPRSDTREELDQVGSEIRARVYNMSISKEEDSSYCSTGSGSSSCSSMPSANWEEELDMYKDKMPPGIRMGYIDVLILYCEDDREAAEKFQTHLRTEIEMPNGPVKTLLYDDAEMQAICGSKIQHLAKGVERSTYVFIFMTKNFIDDKWCEFSSESCLMEAITNPAKQWCVVPVYTEKRNSSFRVPMGLNTLKGINYYNNDRFYRNGVSRLIGDKISVRMHANEEHKIKQKEWLEKHKREQIRLREYQERMAQIEEAKTQQLIDWLDRETRRLIRDGVLPDFIHHSASESTLSSQNTSLSHSSSTSSLKPIHTQNPAVVSYFQKLLFQQHAYGSNEQGYSPEQLSFFQQMHGSTSPLTPGIQNHCSPPVMNLYQRGHGQFMQGQFSQGYFPPVDTSASYPQKNHQVKRSQSQASADMGPSTQFLLHTETGDISVTLPSELCDRIKDIPDNEQQETVRSYLNQIQIANYQQQQQAQSPQVIGARNHVTTSPTLANSEILQRNQMQGSNTELSGTSSAQQQAGMQSSNPPAGVPYFDVMLSSGNDYRSRQPTGSDFSSGHSSSPFQSNLTNSTSSNPTSRMEQLGSNMDGNRSHHEGGNLPNNDLFSSMDADGGSSHNSHQTRSRNVRAEVQNRTVEGTQMDSESDEEFDGENIKRKKGKQKQIIHYHKTVIYQPQVVQVGDHNVVHQQDEENSANSSDEQEQVSEVSEPPATECKTNQEKEVGSTEKHQLMKVEIQPGSETHGEMPDQPNSSGTNSSCNVDAAPSANNLSAVSQEEPRTSGKHLGTKELTAIKSMGELEEEIEEAEEVLPYESNKEFKNNFENSSKFDESVENVGHIGSEKNSRFDESVNYNSSVSEEKSSSLNRKQMPFDSNAYRHPDKPVGTAKPVAAVQPFSPKVADPYDDNCDNTDPKAVVRSEQEARKAAELNQEQTYVKQAWTAETVTPSVKREAEQLQRNIPPQVLLKAADLSESTKNTSAKFSNFSHTNPHRLFYRQTAAPVEIPAEEPSSLESEVNLSGRQEVALGNDPLTRETQEDPASRSFIPQSSPFTPQNENDLGYEMLEEAECPESASSFEESGTKLNKSWNRRGSPPNKKECVIS